MYKILISIILSLLFTGLFAQIPAGYYNGTAGLTGTALKSKLHTIIRGHTTRSYSQLWTDFQTTDAKANGKVWDMYSDVPGGTPSYEFSFGTNQCGSYSGEGSCYNREHSFPKSWWGGGADTMYTDLFHLVPTDGYVNSQRSNYPYGEVGTATWTSTNGSKLGTSNYPGYSGTVFEPIDEYKGDFARNYFYMATRYQNKISTWTSDMLSGVDFTPWALNLLLDWNNQDPVSQKEIDRNNAIYSIQGNRNPFIDHNAWVNDIWNPSASNSPAFAVGYPKSANIANTSFDLLVKQDKAGTAYYVVLADGAASPSAAQVKNGQDASGTAVASNQKGSIAIIVANTQYSATISGLTLGTNYDVYIVSEDNSSPVNLQSTATLLDVLTTGGSSGSQTYTENFDDNSAWSSGSGYTTYTYTSSTASHNDKFTIINGLKETSDSYSTPNSCRLKNAANASLRYECEGTVSSFNISAARWDNSPKPNVTVRYSVDGGANYSTAFTFTGDDFSADKSYQQFSHTFATSITNNVGAKIFIEFVTASGERMLYDNFEITFSSGTGSTNSNESDIVKASTWAEPQNIDYINYTIASGLTTSNAVEIGKFTIRDGGNDLNDADNHSTILTDLSFSISSYNNIAALALFDGANKLAELNSISANVSFSGLSIEAMDDDSKDFSLYATFKTNVVDNDVLKFSINSAIADGSGSTFAASDGGGAYTDNTGDNNKIEVTANHLSFDAAKPPSSATVNTDFEVTVEALDANDNPDFDANQTVILSLSSGSGVLSSAFGLSKNMSCGTSSWTDVQYDLAENITISAAANSFTSIISSNITVSGASSPNYFSDLIVTEYVEGSSSNKYLEIWNNTGSTVDLSEYQVDIYANGNSSPNNQISLSGNLSQDAVYVIANNGATAWSGTPDLITGSLSFNGNDAVALVNNNAKGNVDVLGVIGSSSYFAKDKTLERKGTVTGPSATYDASEWTVKTKDDVSGLGNPGPLPIELLSFSAKQNNSVIFLQWQTASETNNNFFTIQRSNDAYNFKDIAIINGAGNSKEMRSYQYKDVTIDKYSSLYYRLKQTDYNGSFTFSQIINIKTNTSDIQLNKAYVIDGNLRLNIHSPTNSSMSLELINMNGQKLKTKHIQLQKGVSDYNIPLTNTPVGMYMIRLSFTSSVMVRKLLIN